MGEFARWATGADEVSGGWVVLGFLVLGAVLLVMFLQAWSRD